MINRRFVASSLMKIAKMLEASSPFKMTELELELYHALETLHSILEDAKKDLEKFLEKEKDDRDEAEIQFRLDELDEKVRSLPRVTDGFVQMMEEADRNLSKAYEAIRDGEEDSLLETKADLELFAGKVFSEYQNLRNRE